MPLLAEIHGKDLLPLVLVVSGVGIALAGGSAWGLFYLAKRLKARQARMEGIVLALVFAWVFVVVSVLCAGCGVLSAVG